MKTALTIFRNTSQIKKNKTASSQLIYNQLQKQQQSSHQNKNNKLKTVINLSQQYKSCPTNSLTKYYSQENIQQLTQQNKEIYDQDNQYLTTEFVSDWQKMGSIKKQTYNKLRIKLIKKYPQYIQRYKQRQLRQLESKLTINTLNHTHSNDHNEHHSFRIKKVKQNNFHRTGGFYSRSRKKCLHNQFYLRETPTEVKISTTPKMSFMNYITKCDYKKKFYSQHVSGYSMIETKQKILDLQKYGSKSYLSLKKCLEDAIEVCITEK